MMKVLHFLVMCFVISVVTAVLKKDEPKEILKTGAQFFLTVTLLILFFCAVLQLLGTMA